MGSQSFPDGFFWGAATSAHQVEGGNRNDWTEWEKSPARIADLKKRGLNPDDFVSGRACDHYNRFREDFDIAKQLGHNAHRFSIEWSRIEPEEGRFDEREIDHYRKVLVALREQRIKPFVTLWHWTLPIWMQKKGGWESREIVAFFSRYCEKIASEFQNNVTYWMILNEPQYWFWNAYGSHKFPPQRGIIHAAMIYWHLAAAHRRVYRELKKINPRFEIGVVESTGAYTPKAAHFFISPIRNFLFPSLVKGYFDFFGLNYYRKVSLLGRKENSVSAEIGWEIYPEGFYQIIGEAYRRFNKPIVITENGIADSRDRLRGEFIRDHIIAMKKAIQKGADVRGYFYWSLLDNFEWDSGFAPRFGLVEVDYKTMERRIRPSAWAYKEIIERCRMSEKNKAPGDSHGRD